MNEEDNVQFETISLKNHPLIVICLCFGGLIRTTLKFRKLHSFVFNKTKGQKYLESYV